MILLGFDTDAKGSVAIFDFSKLSEKRATLDIYAVPNRHKHLKNGTKRLEVNYPALVAIMVETICRVPAVPVCYLEDQWSRPSQDIARTFTFGKTFGECRTATAAGLLVRGLTPSEIDSQILYVPGGDWKYDMRLDSDKSKSLDLATRMFPECKHAWAKKSLHTSAAEAALLAFWGASKQGIKVPPGTIVLPPETPICSVAQSLVC